MKHRFIALFAVLALSGVAAAGFSFRSAAVVTAENVITPAAIGGGGLIQFYPEGNQSGSSVHMTISGVPFSGTYLIYGRCDGNLMSQSPFLIPRQPSRIWRLELHSPNSPAQYYFFAERVYTGRLDAAGNDIIVWQVSGGVATFSSGAAGTEGAFISPFGNGLGGPATMSGADYNVSATAPFLGNATYGGGGNITISVSP